MTDAEIIVQLKERITKLESELAKAQSPGLFAKFMCLLLLTGAAYVFYKSRVLIKWAVIILFVYIFFGSMIGSAFDSTAAFISKSWTSWKESSAKQAKLDAERENAEAELRRKTDALAAETKAKTDVIAAETKAKTDVIIAEEKAKHSEWERDQISRRNEAINQAIINGTWNSTSSAPEPVSKDSEVKETEPEVQVINNEGVVTRIKVTYPNNK